jgi:hypothetical protein
MNDTDKLIDEFLNRLIESRIRPDEIQVCPICGGTLHVGFGAYKRFDEDAFGITVDCESCDIGMAIDYAAPLPVWLKPQ